MFESIRVFAEIAIPTAMVLTIDKIIKIVDINKKMVNFENVKLAEDFANKNITIL